MRSYSLYSLALAMLMSGSANATEFKSSITVVTSGNVEGAGTDSNIYVKLHGPDGVSPRLRLQDFADPNGPTDILEKGTKQTFNLGVDVGPVVTRIEVESDGKHPGSDWHLDRIISTTVNGDLFAEKAPLINAAAAKADFAKIVEISASTEVKSTFIYENWLKGDETHERIGEPTKHDAGIVLYRKEPVARAVGEKTLRPMAVVVIAYAEALGSGKETTRDWATEITSSSSFTVSEGSSNSVGLGAEVSYSYGAGDAGGANVAATLRAEYNYVKESLKETSSSVETKVKADDTFSAAPGTIQFRIGRADGVVAAQTYESMLQDMTFTGRYVQNASRFNPTEITLIAGKADDDKWNLDVAPEFAAAVGKPAYDRMVKLLLRHKAVANPINYEQAMAH